MSRYNNTAKSRISLNATYNNRAGNVLKYNTTLYEKNTDTDSDIFIKTHYSHKWEIVRINGSFIIFPLATEFIAQPPEIERFSTLYFL